MTYSERLYKLQDELWNEFEKLVRIGAKLPLTSVWYIDETEAEGTKKDIDGKSYFDAVELIKNPDYILRQGEDLIVGIGEVSFIDSQGYTHTLEPDVTDLHFMVDLIDSAQPNN